MNALRDMFTGVMLLSSVVVIACGILVGYAELARLPMLSSLWLCWAVPVLAWLVGDSYFEWERHYAPEYRDLALMGFSLALVLPVLMATTGIGFEYRAWGFFPVVPGYAARLYQESLTRQAGQRVSTRLADDGVNPSR